MTATNLVPSADMAMAVQFVAGLGALVNTQFWPNKRFVVIMKKAEAVALNAVNLLYITYLISVICPHVSHIVMLR